MKRFVDALQEENARLRAENQMLKIHAPYGILTRAAFEIEKRKHANAQFVVFGDIDAMHELNTQYGYEEVNARIRSALQIRSSDLLLTGLWFSGDEIVFVGRGDAQGFCERIKQSFADRAMGITLAHAQIDIDIDAAIWTAANEVQARKANR